jgi:hypothetical protein
MSDLDKEWSFDDELFELRSWSPQRTNLGPNWRSIASRMLSNQVQSSISVQNTGKKSAE